MVFASDHFRILRVDLGKLVHARLKFGRVENFTCILVKREPATFAFVRRLFLIAALFRWMMIAIIYRRVCRGVS